MQRWEGCASAQAWRCRHGRYQSGVWEVVRRQESFVYSSLDTAARCRMCGLHNTAGALRAGEAVMGASCRYQLRRRAHGRKHRGAIPPLSAASADNDADDKPHHNRGDSLGTSRFQTLQLQYGHKGKNDILCPPQHLTQRQRHQWRLFILQTQSDLSALLQIRGETMILIGGMWTRCACCPAPAWDRNCQVFV